MDDFARSPRRVLIGCLATSLALATASARAQTGSDLLLSPFKEGENAVVSADGFYQARSKTDNNDTGVSLGVYNASGRVKLDLDQFAKSWNLNRAQPRAGFDFTTLDIHSSDGALPDHFTDMSVGFGMGIAAEDKWKAGISFGVGYASATTLGDGNGYYGKADLVIGYDFNDHETLGIVLDYNGNRQFLPDVPLPGVVYRRKMDSKNLVIEVGFPFSDITWTPNDQLTIFLRYNIPDGGEANIDYKVSESLHLYGSLSQQNDAFHWNQLENDHDRVLFKQTRAELGVRGTLQDKYSIIVAGGYAFDQRFEVGWDSNDTDTIAHLDPEPYARVGVELKF